MVFVSGTVYDQAAGKLVAAFDDLGAQTLRNIAKPVRIYRARVGPNADAETGPPAADTSPPLADRPSIAVLPFDNMSGDPEQEYFSDGMAEDLITDLSIIANLSVAARNSSFSFKGQMPDIKDIRSCVVSIKRLRTSKAPSLWRPTTPKSMRHSARYGTTAATGKRDGDAGAGVHHRYGRTADLGISVCP